MKGIVKWYNGKKGFGFIYGTGCDKDNSNEVLPEYFYIVVRFKERNQKNLIW